MSLELIPFRPEFRQDAARLLTTFWPDLSDSAAQFSWLLEDNPYAETPLAYFAISEGKVVAMRGFYLARWEVTGAGQSFDTPCGAMFVTDEAVRGRGLGKFVAKGSLEDLAARGYEYVMSFSAEPITYMIQLRQGWHPIQSYGVVSRDKGALWLRRSLGRKFPILRTVSHWVRRRSAPQKPPTPAGPKTVFATLDAAAPSTFDGARLSLTWTPDVAAMSELANAAVRPGLIRHIRPPEYFEWRYREPVREYRFLDWSQGTARGFIALETRRNASKPVKIVDWDATDDDVLMRLFRAVIEFGQFASVSVWKAGSPGKVTALLDQAGFTEEIRSRETPSYRPGMMLKSLNNSAADVPWEVSGVEITDPDNWMLRPTYAL